MLKYFRMCCRPHVPNFIILVIQKGNSSLDYSTPNEVYYE
jgi:hypothetical protein